MERSFPVGCLVLAFTDDQKDQCEAICAHFERELANPIAVKEWNAFYSHKLCKYMEQQVMNPTAPINRKAADTAEEVPILRRILVMLQFVFHHHAVCEYLLLRASFTACSLRIRLSGAPDATTAWTQEI
jgi:hypothetical protein